MNYHFYIIFHKDVHEECYKNLDPKYLENCTFFGVNSTVQKRIPTRYQKKVIFERDLPYYNPLWQFADFCEDSTFLHVYKNERLHSYNYVGFFQYDMVLPNSVFETIDEELKHGQTNTVFYYHKENSYRHLNQVIGLQGWQHIVNIYNELFLTKHALYDVLLQDIAMYHCFLLPREIFRKMMLFFEKAFPSMFEMLGCKTRHLPFHLERMHGVFLILQQAEGHIAKMVQMPGLIHSDTLKDGDFKERLLAKS